MPGVIKTVATKTLSKRQADSLRELRARWLPRYHPMSLIGRTLAWLPARQFVRIKAAMEKIGILDYREERIRMRLDAPEQVGRLKSCEKEPGTVGWIKEHFRPGDVFYDVGSNVGSYSFVAYSVTGGNCTVYSFEPSFSTFASLCQNIRLNRYEGKVVPLQVALSDATGLHEFNYSCVAPGAALHSVGDARNHDGQPFEPTFRHPVLTYRLDDLIKLFRLLPPSHMKIDIDGNEIEVLRGADQTLQDPGLRTLLVEVNEKLATRNEIVACLEQKGFELRTRHPAPMSEGVSNYVFARREERGAK